MYYFLPVVMVVAFNTFYQVAAKGMEVRMPSGIS